MAKAGLMRQIERVFATDGEKLNVKGGAAVAALLFLLWFVIVQTNEQKYFVTVVFAVLLVAQSDPGGAIGRRVEGMSAFAVLGALVTAFGFYVGDKAWGFVVLAVFAVTLACGLAVKLGVHRFAAGLLLNVWFLVVLSLATHDTGHLKISAWDQALAWLIGAAAWIALMVLVWVASRGRWRPAPVMDLPGSQTPVQLTRPVVLFALIRSLALAASAAIAFGGHLPSADWMPIATIVAMKPSLEQSKLFGEQRVVGAAMGAVRGHPHPDPGRQQARARGHHHPPGWNRNSDPGCELRLLRRRDRLCRSHRCRPASADGLRRRGAAGPLHHDWCRHRGAGDVRG